MFLSCKLRHPHTGSSVLTYALAQKSGQGQQSPAIQIGGEWLVLKQGAITVHAHTQKPVLRYFFSPDQDLGHTVEWSYSHSNPTIFIAVPSKKDDNLVVEYYRSKQIVAQLVLTSRALDLSCAQCEFITEGAFLVADGSHVRYAKQGFMLERALQIDAARTSNGYHPDRFMQMIWGEPGFFTLEDGDSGCEWQDRKGLKCNIEPRREVFLKGMSPFSSIKITKKGWQSPIYALSDLDGEFSLSIPQDVLMDVQYNDTVQTIEPGLHKWESHFKTRNIGVNSFKVVGTTPVDRFVIVLDQGPYSIEASAKVPPGLNHTLLLPVATGYYVSAYFGEKLMCEKRFKVSAECQYE